MFPENIVQATFQVAQTKYVSQRPRIKPKNLTNVMLTAFNNGSMNITRATVTHAPGINVLGTIFILPYAIFLLDSKDCRRS